MRAGLSQDAQTGWRGSVRASDGYAWATCWTYINQSVQDWDFGKAASSRKSPEKAKAPQSTLIPVGLKKWLKYS
jgi:hypothetical protein